MITIPAEPEPIRVDLARTALVVIDMQKDFLDPGGFGEALGNDVGLLSAAIGPCKAVLDRARAVGMLVVHTREGHRPDLADAPPAKVERGAPSRRIGDPGPMGRILIRGEAGHDIVPALYPEAGEPVVDKPGKGAFYATDLHGILRNRDIETLIVCGVTTEVCVHTTVREANDRGYRCIVPGDCCGSYFPEFHAVGLRMISAQGGIFGWVTDSTRLLTALGGAQSELVDVRRLERLLRVRDQRPGEPAGAHRAVALRAQDAGRHRVRPHPARHRPHALPEHALLRVARPPPGEADRARRRVRAALRHQRAAHVRGHLRDHAADHAHHRRPGQGLGGRAHVGVRAELRADGGRLHRPGHPAHHPARRAARHPRGRLARLHLDAAGDGDVHDSGDRDPVLRGDPGLLVRRRALLERRARGPGRDRGGHRGRVALDRARRRLGRHERGAALRVDDAGGRRVADAPAHRLPARVADVDRVDERVAHQAADQAHHPVGGQHARGRESVARHRRALHVVERLHQVVDAEGDRGDLIPVIAISPILLYIGMLIGAQAFQETPKSHAPAIVLALTPNLAAWGKLLIDNSLGATGTSAAQVGLDKLGQVGVLYEGLAILGGGAILGGLVLGAIGAFIVDRDFSKAAAFAAAGAVLTFFGFMHGEAIGIGRTPMVALAYVLVAGWLYGCAQYAAAREPAAARHAPAAAVPAD